MQQQIPCVLMRGGTSRGPFFRKDWLPANPAERDAVLLAALGSPHELQLDGIGGGSSLTSKVAIVSRSEHAGCDVDYLFAQVSVEEARVDTKPNCGNMLAGVAPFAIEQGLVRPDAESGLTTVRIFNVNTHAEVEAVVRTPQGRVVYDGEQSIDGVPGTSAPVKLTFSNAWGAVTGRMFPTGNRTDVIDGVPVTCIDAAQVMVLIRGSDLGVRGDEAPAHFDAMHDWMRRLEQIRLAAGRMMGMGDVSSSVLPKPVIVSDGPTDASITSRYFTPLRCHKSHAATGAIGVAVALAMPGTVAHSSRWQPTAGSRQVEVFHPSGRIAIELELAGEGDAIEVRRASLIRTARKILEGTLYLPAAQAV